MANCRMTIQGVQRSASVKLAPRSGPLIVPLLLHVIGPEDGRGNGRRSVGHCGGNVTDLPRLLTLKAQQRKISIGGRAAHGSL
jgi:hypothetical protein